MSYLFLTRKLRMCRQTVMKVELHPEYPGVPGVCTVPVISPYKLHKDFLGDHARNFWQAPLKYFGVD